MFKLINRLFATCKGMANGLIFLNIHEQLASMPFRNCAAIFWLSGTLSVLNLACSPSNSDQSVRVAVTPSPIATIADDVETIPNTPQPSAEEIYEKAMDVAVSAQFLNESAVSVEDWQLSLSRWQEAIALLRQIPTNSPLYAIAKPKIVEYQRNFSAAKQKSPSPRKDVLPGITLSTTEATPQTDDDAPIPEPQTTLKTPQQVFKVPIKSRSGQTPVIEVTFNNGQVFDMIVDTGASGTVITQEMAQSLGLTVEGEITANTASDKGVKFSTTTVNSISVAGAVAKKVRVAIGGEDLEVGLLGQDFFGKYDVIIRQNVVEFHQR
ncbi:MAG: retroviral-like aspartic protease family protein [Coleofasciculaceae cyanobacterium]